jgi:hypothetical protein
MWQETAHGGLRVLGREEPLRGNEAVERALAELDSMIAGAPGERWVIDAGRFEALNSEHIATLIRIVRRVSLANGRIALHRPTAFVCQVLQSLRLVKILPIVEDLEHAERQLA